MENKLGEEDIFYSGQLFNYIYNLKNILGCQEMPQPANLTPHGTVCVFRDSTLGRFEN